MNRSFFTAAFFFATGFVIWMFAADSPIGDYGNYYFGSKLWLQGVPYQEICDPCSFNEHVQKDPMRANGFFLNYKPVPPFSLLFYAPFSFLPFLLSKGIFNLLTLLFFSISIARLLQRHPMMPGYILLLVLVFFLPMRSNMTAGQAYLLMAACLIECWLAEDKPWRAAFFLAIAAALKLYPLALLLYFIVTRRYRVVAYTLFLFVLFSAAGFAAAGESGWLYFTEVVPRLLQNEINDPYAVNYQSVFVFLKSLLTGDSILNPSPLLDAPLLFEALFGVFSGIVLFFAISGIRKTASLQAFSLALVAGAVVSAYSSTYSLLLLMIPAIAVIQLDPRRRNILLVLLTLICLLPVSLLAPWPMPFRFARALALVAFFFFLLPAGVGAIGKRWLALCVVLVSGMRLLLYSPPADGSEYFPGQGKDLLTCGYRQEGNELVLDILGAQGRKSVRIPCRDSILFDPSLRVSDHRLLLNDSLLVGGTDNKRQPAMLGEAEVLYLSDRNRGVGFYALRKINIQPGADISR